MKVRGKGLLRVVESDCRIFAKKSKKVGIIGYYYWIHLISQQKIEKKKLKTNWDSPFTGNVVVTNPNIPQKWACKLEKRVQQMNAAKKLEKKNQAETR